MVKTLTQNTNNPVTDKQTAVVSASLWIIVLDAIAVQLTSVFAYN